MKIINKLLVVSALLVGAAACNKQLDLRPTDTIDDIRAFQTVADLEKGAIGVYSAFGVGELNGIYINSLLSDEAKISNENRGQGQFTFKWQITAGESEHNVDYYNNYRVIDRANRVLARFADIPANNASEEALKKRVEAELLAFRGMAHYELLIRFMPAGYDANAMGVPVITSSILTGKPARNTVGEVMNQIQSDLAAARAIAELPNSVPEGLRLSKAAVAAYQAKAALLKRDWAAAAQFATDAITLSGATLATRTTYPLIWQDATTNSEVILRLRNNYSPQLLYRDANGDVFFEPSDKLKAQYDRVNDVRFGVFFGADTTRNAQGQLVGDTSIVTKYPGSALQGPQNNDLKTIRLSEMYLIRAEARAEMDQLTQAAADINLLRSNRIAGYTDVAFSSKDEAISAILNERFKELPYEGFRFFDLKRRNLPVVRFASDVQSNLWLTLPAGDYRFALPIPQAEVFANRNTLQNPGY